MNDYPAQQQFALKSPPFRRFLYGSFFVRCSDWMDLTILNWIVYEWTHSPLSLGIVNACRLIPVFLFSMYAGGVADKYNRRQSLLVIYSGMMVLTLFIAFIIGEHVSFIILLSAITVRSVLMSFEVPIRNAWLADIVPGSMLGSAITLQTTSINVARMVGPAIAGVLLAYIPAGNIMLWVSAGTLLVILPLLTFPGDQPIALPEKKREKISLRDTFQYILGQPGILAVLLVAIAPMIFGFPYTTMLPLFSNDLMNLGSAGFGFLLSISSLGAIAATGLLTFRQPVTGGRWLIISTLAFGTSLVLFTIYSGFYLAAVGFMFLIGFTSQYYRTLSRIMIQMKVEGEYRGRVLSIALMDRGYIPLGSLFIGWIASSFDVYTAGLSMGMGTILFTLFIVRSNRNLWKE